MDAEKQAAAEQLDPRIRERNIQWAADDARALIASRLVLGRDRRDAARILAHGFGFAVRDDDLHAAARALGVEPR